MINESLLQSCGEYHSQINSATNTRPQRKLENTIRRMRFTTQWRAAFRVKSFKAAVIRGKLPGEGEGDGGGGGGAVGAVGD